MENASQALLMAGGILIALLIISALVIMFANLQTYQSNETSNIKTQQIAEFNGRFVTYEREDLTISDLKSVYNKILSNNERYPEFKILIEPELKTLFPITVRGETLTFGIFEKDDFSQVPDTFKYKINLTFTGTITRYENGRIKAMRFTKNS